MPSVEIALNGSFVRLRGASCQKNTGGGARGKVSGFSRESRKRLLDFLNSVDKAALARGLFVTLTYPDRFPEESERWKRDLDTFLKRFLRKFPGASVVWRLELKPRKSGKSAGEIAPHYHLLVFGLKLIPADWLSSAWYQVVGSNDERHLRAGTQVQRVKSRRGILFYASKYIAKTEDVADEVAKLPTGRVWGIVGRENLPLYLARALVTWEVFYRVRRVLRAWLSRRFRKKLQFAGLRGQGMTAYLDSDVAGRLVAWALLEVGY